MNKIRVTIWNEFRHEKMDEECNKIYPGGLHNVLKKYLEVNEDFEITLAALDDPDQGLPDEVLNNTDVLMWWGHMSHHEVDDALVARILDRVRREGMGFIAMHSSHASKPFDQLVGSTGSLSWGENVNEIMWTLLPSHPIAKGIPANFHLESEELYSEPFCIGNPDDVVFAGWYETGNVMRSGVTFQRGLGKIFYFQPGHEYCHSFHNKYSYSDSCQRYPLGCSYRRLCRSGHAYDRQPCSGSRHIPRSPRLSNLLTMCRDAVSRVLALPDQDN